MSEKKVIFTFAIEENNGEKTFSIVGKITQYDLINALIQAAEEAPAFKEALLAASVELLEGNDDETE